MANIGATPLDPLSLVGQVRLMVGDTDYEPLAPAVAGSGSYMYFSDNAILAFLIGGRQSVSRAVGNAYLQLAAGAALTASTIKTDDLSVSNISRAGDLYKIAQGWFDRADDEDRFDGDIFEVAPTGSRNASLASWPVAIPVAAPVAAPSDVPFGLHEDPLNPGYYVA